MPSWLCVCRRMICLFNFKLGNSTVTVQNLNWVNYILDIPYSWYMKSNDLSILASYIELLILPITQVRNNFFYGFLSYAVWNSDSHGEGTYSFPGFKTRICRIFYNNHLMDYEITLLNHYNSAIISNKLQCPT